jgi:hypothetical protein
MMRSAVTSACTQCSRRIRTSIHLASHPSSGKLIVCLLHSLTGCGHTFCQGCLVNWFSTTLRQHFPPGYTCPSCRHAVRTPPIQNFSIKHIVHIAAESRGESSTQRPPPPPPPLQLPHRHGGPRRDFPPGPFDNFFRSWEGR